jgi:Acetyltransferase (GNAT) family
MQARRGALVDVLAGTGLIAELSGRGVGLATWIEARDGQSAEIRAVAVDANERGQGIGRALLEGAHEALAAVGVGFTWLVTTNDNEPAIRLYDSLGYVVAEIRQGAIDEIRATLKPSIPLTGHGGVGMHDEIELRCQLAGRRGDGLERPRSEALQRNAATGS